MDLPKEVLDKVLSSSLSISAAEELIPIHNHNRQSRLADLISEKRMSTKQVRQLINAHDESVYDTFGVIDSVGSSEDISQLDRIAQRCLVSLLLLLE